MEKDTKRKIELFVPGRLCLFGEHSDWAGRYMAQNAEILSGKAIVTGINLGIYASAEKSENFVVDTFEQEHIPIHFECGMHREILREQAAKDSYFCYCCGVAAYMRENYKVDGIHVDITKVTLPMKKGLSSSAAICVLIAKAFNELYGLQLSTRGIMKIAYSGELLTHSRCGRLDQACAYGERPVVMDFYDEDIGVKKLRVGKTLNWVFADLCAGKNTKKILTDLNKAFPYAQSEIDKDVQDALGKYNHEIVNSACKAIEDGDAEQLGKIMIKAQKTFDDKVAPACPDELKAPVLHDVLNDENIKRLVYGAKGVGSQGDGTVQFLAKDKHCQKKLVDYLNNTRKMEAYPFNINAGGKIKKAIIPIAGFGTRMYPETHFVKKAFLPVPDNKNVIKPVILHILEELVKAGIEELFFIVGKNESKEYKNFFQFNFSEVFYNKLPMELRLYYRQIYQIGKRIIFVEQKEKRGFGHAVFQAKKYVKDEPVLLLLGDFLYKSKLDISCTEQTIRAYYKSGGKSIIAIKEVPIEQAPTYGIVTGEFRHDRDYLMNVTSMVEKPSEKHVKESLLVNKKNGQKGCFATFGQYVLTKEIFKSLQNEIDASYVHPEKEIDLTAALKTQAENNMLVGTSIAGESFDVGIPDMFIDTFNRYPR